VIGDVIAVLRRILAGRSAHHPFDDVALKTPRKGSALPLRAVVRLESLRDAAPARDALAAAGIASVRADGAPAIVTEEPQPDLRLLRGALAAGGIGAAGIIPLWDDLTAASTSTTSTRTAIAAPA
jgi:hypothetical protein